MADSIWTTGLGLATGLAQSGAFGSDGRKLANAINPPNTLAAPNPAPPAPPVAGQQGVNPAPTSGVMDHLAEHWGKYALAGGVLVLLVVGVTFARR